MDFDIWAESIRMEDLLKLEISTEHVPAHQDDITAYEDLPRPAQINVDMDRAAEIMRTSKIPSTEIPVFESSKISITINNAVVTDKLGSRLCYHITGAPLKMYLLQKNTWHIRTYEKVDWITLDQYLKTVPSGKLTKLLKLQHGWQQTASRNRLMYGTDDNDDNGDDGQRPLGCGKEEIKFHYLTCVHQPGYSQVVRETNSLEKYLSTRNTHPDIKAILIHSIRSYLTSTEPTLDWTTKDPIQDTIKQAFEDQCEIFLGRCISSQ